MITRGAKTSPRPRGALLAAGLGALALGAACTTKGEGLILVQLSSSLPLDHALVVIASPSDHSVLGMATLGWPTSPPLKVGVQVSKSVSGSVDVIACGFDATGNLLTSTPNDPASYTATATPGETSAIVMIGLQAGSAPALCGSIGTGGHGGGMGGTGGSGGSVSTGGTGGSGGSVSTGGTGGAGGSGGSVSTGGMGGSTSTGGSGGGAGAAGRGGTGGGGAGGGGAGGGGAGGTGTGGTGTGGTGTGGGGGGIWHGATAIGTVLGSDQTYPAVAVDANGNAVVIYEQGSQIYASKYTATTGIWSQPAPVDSRGSVCCKPSIGVDKNGNYLAVWGISSGSTQGIWQSTSTNGTTWLTPTSIATTNSFGPVLSMNANGAAVVAWTEVLTNGNEQAVASIRTAPGTTWSTPQVMLAPDDPYDRYPAVAMDGKGNAFVGWEQFDGGTGTNWISVWMRQYTAGSGWNAAGLLEGYNDQRADDISIAANATGDAIVTWRQVSTSNPATEQLWARRYSALTSSFATTPSKVFEAASIDPYVSPMVALDDTSNATLVFAVQTSTGYQVQASRTAVTDPSWPVTPTALETNDLAKANDPNSDIAYVTMPAVKTDPAGNVTVVWRKRITGTRFDLVSRRLPVGGSWGAETLLETNTTDSVFWPTLAVGANGTAVTTWYFANTLDVWANVFH